LPFGGLKKRDATFARPLVSRLPQGTCHILKDFNNDALAIDKFFFNGSILSMDAHFA
jgi:hypothetical protein